ncbi:MAG: DUF4136 domain-containing protein [Acidiferrobacterales bacterium]|nr:DUF4136 domain-containing protein [Acidiferrobacterales bacterium]
MLMLHRSLLLLSFVALGGCSTMQVHSDYDPAASFDGLQTYDWVKTETNPTADPRLSDPLLDKRIRELVEKQLATQGYDRSSTGTADFMVGYHVAVEKKLAVSTMNDYYGYRAGWGWSYGAGTGRVMPESYVYEYEQGSLIIDIVNPKTRELMWRGSAQAEVNQKRGAEQLAEAVERILERFPPKQKK